MIDRINLMPEVFIERKRTTNFPVRYIVVAALGIAIVVIANARINRNIKELTARKQSLMQEHLKVLSSNILIDNLHQEAESKKEEISNLENKAESLRSVIAGRVHWSDILKEIAYLVPENVWLNEIRSKTVTVEIADESGEGDAKTVEKVIKDVILKGSSYNNSIIAEFISNLENSYFLQDVDLRFVKKVMVKEVFITYDFEVRMTLKGK